MPDPRFYRREVPRTLADLAAMTGTRPAPGADAGLVISDIAQLDTAAGGDIVYVGDKKFISVWRASACSACITTEALARESPATCSVLIADDPRAAFAAIASIFYPMAEALDGATPIAPDAVIGKDVRLASGVVIGARARIADHVTIGANAVIGPGVEIGAGFEAAELSGEDNADEMRVGANGQPEFLSNRAGGILGGISTGQPIVARVAIKPTSSILASRQTIDIHGQNTEIVTKGRHDPCVGIRGVPVAEAMLAVVLADHLLRHEAQCGPVKR